MLLGTNSLGRNPALWAVIVSITLFLLHTSVTYGPSIEPELISNYRERLASSNSSTEHPIQQLAKQALERFEVLRHSQSTTYEAAVLEYSRRYERLPPPGFQKWFEYALANDSPIIDDYDVLERDLFPFRKFSGQQVLDNIKAIWVTEDPRLWPCQVKNGKMIDCPSEMIENMANVTQHIPDVQMPFNPLDEPRTLIDPGEDASGLDVPYWWDANHHNMWPNMTQACSAGNNPQSTSDPDDDTSIASHGLPFLQDILAARDVCHYDPAWTHLHGFWSTPTSIRITKRPVPVLSPAAPSSMGDVVFPAVAYMLGMYSWDESEAVAWEKKTPGIYWAGSTTGTHITNWTKHWEEAHRQRFVLLANQHDKTRDYTYLTRNAVTEMWEPKTESRFNKDVYHAFFTNIVQCEDGGCEMFKQLFAPYITEGRPRGENSQYTLVFDTDGNGHSGRYYRLLMSHSLPLKQTVFREWHDDRLIPWVHFVPVSLGMEELPEIVRYLIEEDEGRALAKQLAEQGREWAMKSLRPVDQAVYIYRLALEMARLQDPKREADEDWSTG